MIYIGIVLGVIFSVILIILLIAAFKPGHFRIERTRQIAASPEIIFGYINNLSNWSNWSPWDKIDPNMKRTLDGPASGVGASYAWDGNGKVGAGRMEIIDSKPNSHVKLKLDFLRPFKCCNTVIFTMTPDGDQTRVNWAMEGEQVFFSKVFSVICNMDKMVGKDFEKGLESLDKLVASS